MTLLASALYQLVAFLLSILPPAQLRRLWKHKSAMLAVTGAPVAQSCLGSDCKGQCKAAEDYHEHWWS